MNPSCLIFLIVLLANSIETQTVTYESVVSLGYQAGVCGVHKAFSDQKQIEPTLVA